jgi:hypothetical protein
VNPSNGSRLIRSVGLLTYTSTTHTQPSHKYVGTGKMSNILVSLMIKIMEGDDDYLDDISRLFYGCQILSSFIASARPSHSLAHKAATELS